jgi:NRAMP (natural resistance-associated macrophage protein)-like metal ion transporter
MSAPTGAPEPELEPLAGLASRPRGLRQGLALRVHGRTVRLRGFRRPASGLLRWLYILGPGLIAASAGNDAGGIATYSAAGAQFGYDLIWVMVLITISLAVIQEMCARLGAATGRGLLDLIREQFGLGWALLAVVAILVANAALIVTEFIGVGAAANLLGLNPWVVVPAAAVLVWYLVIFGSYAAVEKIFLGMTLVFFAYPIAAVLAHPDWGAVLRGAVVPTFRFDQAYLLVLVGLLGTTITPYMQIFEQSAIVERAVPRRHYGPERADSVVGAVFSNLMSIAMIVATAATLHARGAVMLQTAADAAKALEPVAGAAAKVLFAVGLLGASLLAGAVLPLATAYAVAETFGQPKGVSLDFRRAPLFFGLFTLLIALGAGLALWPNAPVIPLLVAVQVFNGALLPLILFFVLRLANNARLMGDLKNSRRENILGWGTTLLVAAAVMVLLAAQVLSG